MHPFVTVCLVLMAAIGTCIWLLHWWEILARARKDYAILQKRWRAETWRNRDPVPFEEYKCSMRRVSAFDYCPTDTGGQTVAKRMRAARMLIATPVWPLIALTLGVARMARGLARLAREAGTGLSRLTQEAHDGGLALDPEDER